MKRSSPFLVSPTAPRIVHLLLTIPDRRQAKKVLYPLPTILFIVLAGTLAGMNGWKELALFAEARRAWLADYVDVSQGLPDDEVLRRVVSGLSPAAFEKVLLEWTRFLAGALAGDDLNLDGKSLRGARGPGSRLVHLLHVWASKYGVLLAQRAVAGAPGEAPAVPDLLALLDVRGATLSGDASFCTKKNTEAVRDAHAHYLFTLKGNRGAIHAAVEKALENPARLRWCGHVVNKHVAVCSGHGRRERRTVWAVEASKLDLPSEGWRDLRTVVRIKRERYLSDGTQQIDNHYYLTSRGPDARDLGRRIRRHWSVENECHWQLDVAFDEDRSAVRNANAANNLAVLRRVALMLIKRDTSLGAGIAIRVKMAGANPEYLAHLLTLGLDT